MAIILEAAYSKKLGLPHYSSHSYVVSLRTELADLAQVEAESARLYALLQQSVDGQIQQVGFLPEGTTYGVPAAGAPDHPRPAPPLHGHGDAQPEEQPVQPGVDAWTCSDKQRTLILSLVEQHGLDKKAVEALARERFGLPVKTLNRMQASGLIEALLARHGQQTNGSGTSKFNGGSHRRAPARV